MLKKFIFVDLDGTILDHATNSVPEKTIEAFKIAQENGHEVVLTTGRPPCLFYGIDKKLNLSSFIGANGRVGLYHGKTIINEVIDVDDIKKLVDFCKNEGVDIAYEGLHEFALESKYDVIYKQFSENFNLEYPVYKPGFYLENDVYQMTLYFSGRNFEKFEEKVPNLHFAYSCEYGIDVNTNGGLKEKGIKAFMEKLNIDIDDVIAIGDGFNDIGMLEFAGTSVAMGNAHEDVKKHATFVTDHIMEDGLYNAFKKLGLLEKK